MITTYEQALAYIHGRTQFKKVPTLERMKKMVAYLSHPEQKITAIHVTGTNGKGSTTAFLRNLLQSQGFSVGTYTSPFIEKFNDRICVNGKMISDDDIVALVNQVAPTVARLDEELKDEDGGPTEFEIITAMMLVYFASHPVDYVIVEVGMGGLYDSTNVISPLLSIITNVALDHAKFLGTTIEQIATHKAGIIKDNTPLVSGALNKKATPIVAAACQKHNASWYQLGEQFNAKLLAPTKKWGERFEFDFAALNVHETLFAGLLGVHQASNASVALTAFLLLAKMQQFTPSLSEITHALATTQWAGRFERLNDEPLVVIDGAHNPDAIAQQVKTLKRHFASRHIYLLVAILADKNVDKMIDQLIKLPNVTLVATTFTPSHRKAFSLAQFKRDFPTIKTATSWQEGLAQISHQASSDDMILITGSLYFISEVRVWFLNE